jgi:hypothetical protein
LYGLILSILQPSVPFTGDSSILLQPLVAINALLDIARPGPSFVMLSQKPLLTGILLTLLLTIVFITRYELQDGTHLHNATEGNWEKMHKIPLGEENGGNAHSTLQQGEPCTEDLSWLEQYKLTPKLKYVSRDIVTKPVASDRPLLTEIDALLFNNFKTVDMSISKAVEIQHCLPPLTLEVQHGQLKTPDASDMIFSLQTTVGRLKDSVKYLNRWLPHTGARLYCIVKQDPDTPAKDEEMRALETEFHNRGMNVSVRHPLHPDDSFEQRYFSLVNVMYSARSPNTKWMVTIDDDTFFPSLHELRKMLSRHDETKPQYISALSEDWWAVDHYGFMGFGGASIILSVPMVKILDAHTRECYEHPSTWSGDVTIMDCIYRFSTTKLTNIPELYQMDMHNDLSGFYESGRPVLSLHHWKEGNGKVEIDKTHLIADLCDDCYLQRWQFQNDLVLSNGFSIHTYPQGHLTGTNPNHEMIDLLPMEETWDDSINVKHSLNPLRPKMAEGTKWQYKMIDSGYVEKEGKKVLRQVYVRRVKETDEVMVLNWSAGDGELVKGG